MAFFVVANGQQDCPANVELVSVVGESQYPRVPIVVTSQSTKSVSFQVSNTFSSSMDEMFVQYKTGTHGKYHCVGETSIPQGGQFSEQDFTAYCMKNSPITIVDIWMKDSVGFDSGLNNAMVPSVCKRDNDVNKPGVQYTFRVHCESQCPQTSTTTNTKIGNVEQLVKLINVDKTPSLRGRQDDQFQDDQF